MYYPKSKIETNLYSNGDLLIKSSLKSYYGLYFATSDGRFYSGKEPNDGPNLELIQVEAEVADSDANAVVGNISDLRYANLENTRYSNLSRPSLQTNFPISFTPQPTEGDYQTGEITRFFAKKRNENIYYEVQDTSVSSNPIYAVFSLQWVISGKEDIVSSINKNTVSLYMRQLPIPAFDKFLKNDYLKFWKPS